MPKPLGTLLNHAFTIAGVKSDNQDLIAILSNPALSQIQVPDEIVTQIESNLHSLDSAKAKLSSTIAAEALNGIDAHLERFAKEDLQLDDASLTELKAEKKTAKRVEILVKKIQSLEASKAASKGGDKEGLAKEINELKSQLAQAKNDAVNSLQNKEKEFESTLTKMDVKRYLAGKKYVFPKDMDPDIVIDSVYNTLERDIQSENVKFVRDGSQIKLVTNDGTDYYDKQNKKQDFKAFVDSSLSRNKLLATTQEEPPGGGGAGGNNHVITGTDKLKPGDQKFLNDLEAQIQAELKVAQ